MPRIIQELELKINGIGNNRIGWKILRFVAKIFHIRLEIELVGKEVQKMDKMDIWEFYADKRNQWRWRRRDFNNNKIIGASTEGYKNFTDCKGNAIRNGYKGVADEKS